MRIESGQTVLLTGASGGLGVFIVRALADFKVKLALVAYPGVGLEPLRDEIRRDGVEAEVWVSDLSDRAARRDLAREVEARFGGVDILVNNAGVEYNAFYHDLPEERICEVLGVNLEAAMIMTRLVLPGMLKRGRGHIVSMSSLAGKSGPAFQEPYAATKAGLIGFTSSLRATYRNTGVSASVVIPGFVDAGIYERLKLRTGTSATFFLTGNSPLRVADAVIRVIEHDIQELIVNRWPIRPMLALTAISPSLGDWVATKLGVHDFFRKVVDADKAQAAAEAEAKVR